MYDSEVRRDVAAFARRYFAGKVTLDTFLEYSVHSNDPLILTLRDALVHEPARSGWMGLRERMWRSRYWEPVQRLVAELDKGADGEVPEERVYPRITLGSLVLGAALLLCTGLIAARHLDQLLTEIHQQGALSSWQVVWRSGFIGFLGLTTATGLEGWIYRVHLYRTRKLH